MDYCRVHVAFRYHVLCTGLPRGVPAANKIQRRYLLIHEIRAGLLQV